MAGYAIVPDIDAPELTGTDIAVWSALCRFAQWEMDHGKPVKSKAGTCYPSQQEIAKICRFSIRAVYNALIHLEALGYVRKEARRRGGNFISTTYELTPEAVGVNHDSPSAPRANGTTCQRHHVPTGPAPRADGHRHHVPTNSNIYNIPIEQEKEAEAKAAAESPDRVSLSQVTKLWNDRLGPLGFPTVMKETPSRQRAFTARVNESPERHTLEWWRGLMARIAGAAFLVDSAKQKAKWLAFDWVLNENNLVKILEGRYDRRQEERGQPSPKRQQEPPPQTWAEAVARYRKKHGYTEGDDNNAGTGLICVS